MQPPEEIVSHNHRSVFDNPKIGDTLEAFTDGVRCVIQVHYNNGDWVGFVKQYGDRECCLMRTELKNWRENSRVGRVLSDAEVSALPGVPETPAPETGGK